MQTQRLGIWAGLVSSKKTIFKPCTLVLGRNIVLPVEFLAAVWCSFSPGGPLKVKYSIEKSTFMDFELYREKQWVKLVDSNVNRSKAFRNNLVARLITCSAFSNILSFARELPICKKGKRRRPVSWKKKERQKEHFLGKRHTFRDFVWGHLQTRRLRHFSVFCLQSPPAIWDLNKHSNLLLLTLYRIQSAFDKTRWQNNELNCWQNVTLRSVLIFNSFTTWIPNEKCKKLDALGDAIRYAQNTHNICKKSPRYEKDMPKIRPI